MDIELAIELAAVQAVVGLFYVLIGILLSLPVAIPRVRASLSPNKTARMGAAAVLGVSSLAVSSVVFARFLAEVNYMGDSIQYYSSLGPLDTHEEEVLASGEAIVQEFWLREIVPPPLQRECISGKPTICQYADELTVGNSRRAGWSWGSYLGQYSMGVIAFVTTSLIVLRLTRKKLTRRSPDCAG